jgi:hypothetical protein
MSEKEVIVTSLLVDIINENFRHFNRIWLPLLRFFSRIYEFHVSERVDDLQIEQNYEQHILYENSQRLFSTLKFSLIENLYQKALTLLSEDHVFEFLNALHLVAK